MTMSYLNRCWNLLLGLILGATILPLFAPLFWWAGLLEHVRLHLIWALLLLILIGLVLQKERKGFYSCSILLLLFNGLTIWPYPWPEHTTPAGTAAEPIEIIHLNTNRGAIDLTELDYSTADILFLQEVTPEFIRQIETVDQLKSIELHPRDNTQGSAMLLNPTLENALVSTEIIYLPDYSTRPLLTALFEINGAPLRIMSVHTTRPRNQQVDRFQQIEFEALAAWSLERQAAGEAVILIGDFNATPWSTRFQSLLTDGALSDSMRTVGVQNSWPGRPFRWAGIPIDGAVHSATIHTIERHVKSLPSTDHAVLSLTIGIEKRIGDYGWN